MNEVLILGCGPAGLFAARGIRECGGYPIIISKKVKSEQYGAQFLHRPIRGLTDDNPITVIGGIKLGTEEGYARRVYGNPDETTSWRKLNKWTYCWDLPAAYDRAWEEFADGIVNMSVGASEVGELSSQFALVISTVPKWSICEGEHHFESIDILVEREAKSIPYARENYICYNGMQHGGWYRTSKIFGHGSTEYVAHKDMQLKTGMQAGFKVVGTDCDCHPNVVFAGRLGRWERGVLTHHAYEAAIEAYMERFPRAMHKVQ
jgi:hypothetical protein